ELASRQVKVIALLPSLTDTDMVSEFQPFHWMVKMSPQQVARVLVTGLRHNSPEIAVGWQSHLALMANRIAPQLVEWFVKMAMPGSGFFSRFKDWRVEVRNSFRRQGHRLWRSQS
ncbi:MAG: hypothetical protein WCA35_31800, partial [Kovacikia sp.]